MSQTPKGEMAPGPFTVLENLFGEGCEEGVRNETYGNHLVPCDSRGIPRDNGDGWTVNAPPPRALLPLHVRSIFMLSK